MISGGIVTSVMITNAGSGYTSPPSVTFAGGGGSGAAGTTTIGGWDRWRVWVHCVVAFPGQPEVHYGGDWATTTIYTISSNLKTDAGVVIPRRRRAPHLTQENKRRFYSRFELDCDVATGKRIFWNRLGAGRDRIWQIDTFQPSEVAQVTITLLYSDDRGQTWNTMYSQNADTGIDVQLANAYLEWTDASWH
jgi:hypothetical protein